MILEGYRINLDALLARIIYRWHWRVALGVASLLAVLGLVSGLIPPVWKGKVSLTITAPADAQVEVDGRPWPYALYAGDHQIVARHADGRVVWADVSLTAGDALTVTLPPGRPEPRERILPPPTPGSAIAQVWWADGAWRVLSLPIPHVVDEADTTAPARPTPLPGAGQTIAVSATGTERLATLDAYAGLADQVHVGSQLVEAVFVPNARAGYGDTSPGTVEVRGWGTTNPITITAPLTLVRFAPSGDALLLAEQVVMGGEQVSLVQPGRARLPVVAVPGHITRLAWRDDGSAVALHSRQGERLTLTLVRLAPSITAAVVADIPAGHYAGDLVPLTWDDTGLLWVAPGQDGRATLWHAPLTTLLPERAGPFDARALTRLPDGTLRAVVVQEEQVVIGQYDDGLFIGQTIVPGVPAAADLAGAWHGDELLLQTGAGAWLLDVAPEPTMTHARP